MQQVHNIMVSQVKKKELQNPFLNALLVNRVSFNQEMYNNGRQQMGVQESANVLQFDAISTIFGVTALPVPTHSTNVTCIELTLILYR